MYTKANMPDAIKKLPDHAQDIWIAAFNAAWSEYKGDEARCAATAWAAVKQQYEEKAGQWQMMQAAAVAAFSGRILGAAIADKADQNYGWRWKVQVIDAGEDKIGFAVYPLAVLHAAAPLYEGAPLFALSKSQHVIDEKFGHSVRDLAGRIQDVKKNARGLEGTAVILRTAANKWLRDGLVDAFEQGMLGAQSNKDILGLSHDVQGMVTMQGGKRVAQKITKVNSVDVVYDPIGGGKFLRMAAAAGAASQKEASMFRQLLAALKQQRPDLKADIEALEAKGEAATDAEVQALMASATKPLEKNASTDQIKSMLTELTAAVTQAGTAEAKALVAAAEQKFADTQKLLSCASVLVSELEASQLPDLLKARVRREFEGKPFETTALQAAIKEEKEIADKLTASGLPQGGGDMRIAGGEGEPERLQAALDKLFDCDVDAKHKDVPAFRSLRAAYTRITGDPELRGLPSREGQRLGAAFMQMMNLPAAYASTSFSFVLGVSMFKRLLKEYKRVDYREDALISFKKNALDFKTQEIISVGYFGDISDVNPETGDYAEVAMPTDVEATYAVNQKGNILTVTRRVLLNDDLKSLTQLVAKLGRAARRTHAKRAWNKIIDNANYKGDATALFHVNHGNLGATTLTLDATGIATLTARLQAMYAQAEQDSGEGLGLVPLHMWVSRELLEIAQGLNTRWEGTTANPHAGKFGQNHERIICNPLFTEANNWGLIADGNDVELLEAAYINGNQEPEFFVADNPTVGQMFLADKIQYKIRHEYEFEIADFRGFDKTVASE